MFRSKVDSLRRSFVLDLPFENSRPHYARKLWLTPSSEGTNLGSQALFPALTVGPFILDSQIRRKPSDGPGLLTALFQGDV